MDQEGDEGREHRRPRDREPAQQAAAHRPQRCHDESDVGSQADEALLGGNGDRLGVGDRDGGFACLDVLAVGLGEAAGAVAVDGTLAEEVDAAGDQVGATAGVDVDAVEAELGSRRRRRPRAPPGRRRRRPPRASTASSTSARRARPGPPSSAAKLDCEKVGTSPIQRTATSAVSSASVRRSRAQSSALIATTATSARYRP